MLYQIFITELHYKVARHEVIPTLPHCHTSDLASLHLYARRSSSDTVKPKVQKGAIDLQESYPTTVHGFCRINESGSVQNFQIDLEMDCRYPFLVFTLSNAELLGSECLAGKSSSKLV